MTKMYRCFFITIDAPIKKTTRPTNVTVISNTHVLDRPCIEYHDMVANATYCRSMLIGIKISNSLHPANQFRTVTVKRQDIGLVRRKFIIDKYLSPTCFIQHRYLYPITKFTQTIYQDNIHILNKCIMPDFIISNVILDILYATVISYRDIV